MEGGKHNVLFNRARNCFCIVRRHGSSSSHGRLEQPMQVTENQRKHYTQMSIAEQTAMRSYIDTIPQWTLGNGHMRDRLASKGITDTEIYRTIAQGHVIEAHANNYPDVRFVLRHEIGNRAICICANKQGFVFTAWSNNSHDNHRTLNRTMYAWQVDLTAIFK